MLPRRQRWVRHHIGLAGLVVIVARAVPEGNDLDGGRRPPARDDALVAIDIVGAVGELRCAGASPEAEAQMAGQRQYGIELDACAAAAVHGRERGCARLLAGLAQPQVDDAGRRDERKALLRKADAHARRAKQAVGQPEDGRIEIETLDPHIAGAGRREAAHIARRVDAERLAAEAEAERILGLGDRVFVGTALGAGGRVPGERRRDRGRSVVRREPAPHADLPDHRPHANSVFIAAQAGATGRVGPSRTSRLPGPNFKNNRPAGRRC